MKKIAIKFVFLDTIAIVTESQTKRYSNKNKDVGKGVELSAQACESNISVHQLVHQHRLGCFNKHRSLPKHFRRVFVLMFELPADLLCDWMSCRKSSNLLGLLRKYSEQCEF